MFAIVVPLVVATAAIAAIRIAGGRRRWWVRMVQAAVIGAGLIEATLQPLPPDSLGAFVGSALTSIAWGALAVVAAALVGRFARHLEDAAVRVDVPAQGRRPTPRPESSARARARVGARCALDPRTTGEIRTIDFRREDR